MPFGPLRGARAPRRIPGWLWLPAFVAYVVAMRAVWRSGALPPATFWSAHALVVGGVALVLAGAWLRRRRRRGAAMRAAEGRGDVWLLVFALWAGYGAADAAIRAGLWARPPWFSVIGFLVTLFGVWVSVRELGEARALLRRSRGGAARSR